MTDGQLLQDFLERKSQDAFTELVRRHIDWVYSAACRLVIDPHLAEDVTQATFILVAQKARQLVSHRQFNGWLFRTMRYCAANALKRQAHRRRHEKEARTMRPEEAPDARAWSEIAPQLDAALAALPALDREALLLKFYQGKNAAEVAVTLQVTEDAARKRIQRAVEKLRGTLGGACADCSALSAVIAAHATHAAPAHLAGAATAAALTTKSTLAALVAKATLKTMAWAKCKLAAGVLAGTAVISVAGYEAAVRIFPAQESAPVPLAEIPSLMAVTAPATAAAVEFDGLYEKAPPSKADLTMTRGPNTFAVTAVIRVLPGGKMLATNNLGLPIDPATLPLSKIKPTGDARNQWDVLLVQLSPDQERYHIDRLRLFDHATRRHIPNAVVTPVAGLSALEIATPQGTLPAQIDLWLALASYPAGSAPVKLRADKAASATIAGSVVSFSDLRDGNWSYAGGAFTTRNEDPFGDDTSLQLQATRPWTAGRLQISAVFADGLEYLADYFIDFNMGAPILHIPAGLANIDHFELRPYSLEPPFYFDGVTPPPVDTKPAESPVPAPRIVRAAGRARAKLPSGAEVELAGIAHHPSADGVWWDLDGARIDPPAGSFGGSVSADESQFRLRELLARVSNNAGAGPEILWQIIPATSWAGGGNGATSRIAAALPGAGPATVRIGVPISPWRTLEEIPAEKLPARATLWPALFGALQQADTSVVFPRDILEMPDNMRCVLVDAAGKVRMSSGGSSSVAHQKLPPWGLKDSRARYAKLQVEDVRAVRLETRRVEYAEFKDIPLEPR